MTTYNTGNPVGSTDPRDLYDNAENLDEAVNSSADTFQDRLGKSRLTWSGIVKSGSGDPAIAVDAAARANEAAGRAEVAEAIVDASNIKAEVDRAEAAADVAMSAGWVYATVAEGEAVRADGDYFWVVSADDSEVLELWLMGATTATDTGKRTSSESYVKLAHDNLLDLKNNLVGLNLYTGEGSIHPLVTDRYGKVLIGYDEGQEKVIAAGLSDRQDQDGVIAQTVYEKLDDPVAKAGINHVISYGQSLSIGAKGQPAISTSQPYSNITFSGGPRVSGDVYEPFKPLVEDDGGGSNRGETPCSGAINYATTLRALDGYNPSDNVVLGSAAGVGGYRIDQLEKGTSTYSGRFLKHVEEAKAINPDHVVQAVLWAQGETDGTGSTPYQTYYDKFNQMVSDLNDDIKLITGQTEPIYLITYQTSSQSRTWRKVQQAQLDTANANDKVFMSTPIYHIEHDVDSLHLTAKGYKRLGAYFGKSYKALLDEHKPKWLNPLSATHRSGTEIRIKFDVPHRPLVLDKTTLADTTDYGFAVEDSTGILNISSISIDGDYVVIQLSTEPAGDTFVRYAMDYLGTGISRQDGASGNLRDSDPSTIKIETSDVPLYNVSPHFELQVIILGE